MIGQRIGPYEITDHLGSGGMGEVYRATDTNLGRQVAIKVLPEAFAQDLERLARFEREARTLASVNHLNIAGVYGLERSSGVALVMELVEGPTLADRIAQGPIAWDEALPIATQIAEALEAAHEQSIVHRDLKPANVKVRADGTVKVLDFGLAKAVDPANATAAGLSLSPTITAPAPFPRPAVRRSSSSSPRGRRCSISRSSCPAGVRSCLRQRPRLGRIAGTRRRCLESSGHAYRVLVGRRRQPRGVGDVERWFW